MDHPAKPDPKNLDPHPISADQALIVADDFVIVSDFQPETGSKEPTSMESVSKKSVPWSPDLVPESPHPSPSDHESKAAISSRAVGSNSNPYVDRSQAATPFTFKETENKAEITNTKVVDFISLMYSSDTDFLIRNNGEQVNIDSLKGKKLGLYFTQDSRFTHHLIEFYNKFSTMHAFEIVYVFGYLSEGTWKRDVSEMPWLAVPFSDSNTRDLLMAVFEVKGAPNFVFIDENGQVLNNIGVNMIKEYGVEGYPFSPERIQELKEIEKRARKEQSLKSLLVSESCDFVISFDGKQVPVSELEGKTIGLLFSVASYRQCTEFAKKLATVYKKLKETENDFEVIYVSLDKEEDAFKKHFVTMPWLAIPFNNKFSAKLNRYFEVNTQPTLVILGPDGKTLHSNVVEAIELHGVYAYPFTPEKLLELEAIEKARLEAQSLESLLVSDDLDYVIGKAEDKVAVSSLVGKNILLFFSIHCCFGYGPFCSDTFLSTLIETYHKIKSKDNNVEVIFISISGDPDQSSFDNYFSKMPWLALPFADPRNSFLSHTFKVSRSPTVVALGPTGKTVSLTAEDLISKFGANAYPFTEERMKDMEAEYREMAKSWPNKMDSYLHEGHELLLGDMKKGNYCHLCEKKLVMFSYRCEGCNLDYHPKCVFEEEREGWVCDGEVCYKP